MTADHDPEPPLYAQGRGRPAKLAYSVPEVADLLGLSEWSVRKHLIQTGILATVPYPGHRTLVARCEVNRFLSAARRMVVAATRPDTAPEAAVEGRATGAPGPAPVVENGHFTPSAR